MKNKKFLSTLFYIISAVFNIGAVIGFTSKIEMTVPTVFLCVGSTFLCLGSVFYRKANDNKQHNEVENGDSSEPFEDNNSAE